MKPKSVIYDPYSCVLACVRVCVCVCAKEKSDKATVYLDAGD